MPANQPNIILFMDDQHRGDCLSSAGHPAVQTPNLDALAAQGAFFSAAYSTCPSCIAARRSLMSGMSPARHGVVGFVDGREWNPPTTLPQEFARAGYQTAFVGRTMHMFPRWRRYGFEHFEPSINGSWNNEPPTRYELEIAHNNPDCSGGLRGHGIDANGWVARPWHLDECWHETNWTTSQAIHFLARRDPNRPYFLVVSYEHPHPPLVPPADYFNRYLNMELPAPAIGDWAKPPQPGDFHPASDRIDLRGAFLRQCHAGYYGLINHIDDQFSRVLQPRSSWHIAALNNTIVMFTSDHGEMLGDHYMFRKYAPYEGALRIPMLFRGPGIKKGLKYDHPVCHEDIMPTLLDLAGCDIPQQVDGHSLAPVLRGDNTRPVRDVLHCEHSHCVHDDNGFHCLTDGRWKYAWYTHDGAERLFDLQNDRRELHNLSNNPRHADEMARWRQRLIRQLNGRPEGFTDGNRLITGRPYQAVVPGSE